MNTTSFGPKSLAEMPVEATLMDEVTDVRQMNVSNGHSIGYTLLNKHMIGEVPPIVSIGGFTGDLTTPDRAWEGVQLATLERPVMQLDLPGHGMSSAMTSKQIVDLCISRDATSQAEPMLEAVKKVFEEDPLDYFGYSHGGLMALKMTEIDPIDRVTTVFGLDIPALKKRWTVPLQFGYIIEDGRKGKEKYKSERAAAGHDGFFDEFKSQHNTYETPETEHFIRKNTGGFLLNLVSSINASPAAADSIEQILATKNTNMSFVTGEHSSVSDANVITGIIEGLSEDEADRITQLVLLEDHNITTIHVLPRAVQFAEKAYGYRQ